jgi:3-hydroxy-9,10-secoandrosta-1,3,5(10)-triene-9,17-dione monooxygenase reductase component
MLDEPRYRALMGRWATGVSVVTSMGERGARGATANALTSLSLDPLLLLVCFAHESNTLQAVRESSRFGVSVLSLEQEWIAKRFAVKAPEDEKFHEVSHTVAAGVPVIDGCLAWLACHVHEELRGGDHAIVIGTPFEGDVAEGAEPLLFYGGGYRRLS